MNRTGDDDSFPRLLGDIGATNARFALQLTAAERPTNARTLSTATHRSLGEAVERYLEDTGAPRPRWAAFGIAYPVVGGRVSMTNHNWTFLVSELKHELGLARLVVLNDFTALALAIPRLDATEVTQIGGGAPRAGAPIALIGPGTGLGMSGLVPCQGEYTPLRSEGGHVTLAAFDDREAALIARLRERHGHVSAERVLTGRGLVELYEACASVASAPPESLTAAEVSARGRAGTCPIAREALDTFCMMLGMVAADLALVLGALGGVYIGGGIVPKLGDYFAQSHFRARFEQKGRLSGYLAQVPTYVIQAAYPGLLGAAQALDVAQRGASPDWAAEAA